MCGISGILNLTGAPVDKDLLVKMNDTLSHRGPDDSGYYLDQNIGLGHRRLSIIDLNTGQQPIYNEDNTIVVVFNGEIYNFKELRERLRSKGHQFFTQTDTEVIIHGYEQWGTACVKRFRGMFAFALWDANKKELFLARDRLGIKPLYYYYDGKKILFASEIKALLQNKQIRKTINLKALSDYISLGYVPNPKSILENIYKLSPGHHLVCRSDAITIKQYWDLEFTDTTRIGEEAYCEQLINKLEESVRLRLLSDVPLGSFLSGGIDSSLVVGLMAKLLEKPVVTNSVGFSVQEFNELPAARTISNYFKTDHNEFTVTPDILDVIDTLAWQYDEPFADASSIPTYYVSQMTRQNVTVALSGDGGDENFAGYRRYYFDRLENRLRGVIPEAVRKLMIGSLARVYPKADWLPQVFRAKTLLTNLSVDPVFGYFNSMSMILPSMKSRLFSNELKKALKGYDSICVFKTHYDACNCQDPLSKIQYIDFKTYLPEDILTKVDRASMANALEVRVPLLDHEFVEFAATIPSDLKLKQRQSKYIFKQAAGKILPASIISRKKMGFSIPIGQWMKTELKPLVQELLINNLRSKDYFNKPYIESLWTSHLKGIKDNTQSLWTLLCFELWRKKYSL